jgi:hypothetical protein
VPIEYYTVVWRSFADNSVVARSLPFRATIIDTSLVKGYMGPNKYLAQIISECLDDDKRRTLATAYRQLKNTFMDQPGIDDINKHLANKKGDVTTKDLTVSLDMSAHATWESNITAHLDDIPFDSVGKGEQCRVQMKLAIEAASDTHVLLIEEPENHLSHSNMCRLIHDIGEKGGGKQIVLTTHSSFVLNKLGIDNVKLLSTTDAMTLNDLSAETRDYFMKLPGYNTLRLLLSHKTILVEGPSDELIVQKAYKGKHGKMPLDDGIDVIAVGSLAFKRFLEIGKLLKLSIRVVTDNDGDVTALKTKYHEYLSEQDGLIQIYFDTDEQCQTLEPQLLKANSRQILNKLLGTTYKQDADILSHMRKNKTDVALQIFNSDQPFQFPTYIDHAIAP